MAGKTSVDARPARDDTSPVSVNAAELISLRHAAQGLQLRAGRIRSLQGQQYVSPFKGRGMEFDESRPYQPGDDVRSLDWRVTARSGKPHTKLYREERERPVILAVDYRPSMMFATQGVFKSVQAAHCAALLAWRATQQGDRVGGFIFTDQDHWEMRPSLRASATLHLLEQLAVRGQTQPVAGDANPDALRNALARLRRVVRPGSLVTVISDFRGLDDSGAAHLAQLSRHNELVLIFIYDPLERELPPAGRYRVTDGRRERLLDSQGTQTRSDYAARFTQRRERIAQLCMRHRMLLIPCATHETALERLRTGLMVARA